MAFNAVGQHRMQSRITLAVLEYGGGGVAPAIAAATVVVSFAIVPFGERYFIVTLA